ncbi:hypothetical protein [Bradyrhizobium guangzhouense]|uniref:Uncharacterized protein n=1 Tax=Bradyrhizobium guangzhouense TaxID=1325095 RepID=A0AAE6CAK6_9BRAD|nr:hypothetical protein [Bradyrhizobium guangzhouense]QAU48866.1 hypothetical protein XH91_28260 [Bradyrhizobium guangzhouense]
MLRGCDQRNSASRLYAVFARSALFAFVFASAQPFGGLRAAEFIADPHVASTLRIPDAPPPPASPPDSNMGPGGIITHDMDPRGTHKYEPYWDDAPLFVGSIPKGDIGKKVVLKVKVLRFITSYECTTAKEDHPIEQSDQLAPTTYAFAEVLSVVRGTFSAKRVMLCDASQPSERFAIGQTGLVFGTPSANADGHWRLIISETNRQRVARERAESN